MKQSERIAALEAAVDELTALVKTVLDNAGPPWPSDSAEALQAARTRRVVQIVDLLRHNPNPTVMAKDSADAEQLRADLEKVGVTCVAIEIAPDQGKREG
jgi:hypothetical protein